MYNINGQIDFSKKNQIADFPKGDFASKQVGAVEIKFAWKIMTVADIKERYYINEGFVIDESTQKPVKKELGMIGFHISQKTPTGKQWVWSTFEHIDNLDQNTMDQDGRKKPIHPSLTDPNCEICPVNIDVSNGSDTFTYMAKRDRVKFGRCRVDLDLKHLIKVAGHRLEAALCGIKRTALS